MRRLLAAAGIALLALTPLHASVEAIDHPGALPLLAGIEAVRTDLKLNSLQRAVLDSLRDEYKASARKLFTPPPETPEARAEVTKKLHALNAQYNARVLSTLNPVQQKRIVQIEQQILGATVLVSPTLQGKLGLNDKQKQKIESLRSKGLVYVSKVNRQFEDGKIGYFEKLKLLRTKRFAVGESMLKVLTPEQKQMYAALGGEKLKS